MPVAGGRLARALRAQLVAFNERPPYYHNYHQAILYLTQSDQLTQILLNHNYPVMAFCEAPDLDSKEYETTRIFLDIPELAQCFSPHYRILSTAECDAEWSFLEHKHYKDYLNRHDLDNIGAFSVKVLADLVLMSGTNCTALQSLLLGSGCSPMQLERYYDA